MTSLDPAAWHDFFVGSMGASAALTGLLFVAISINLEQILKFPNLPGRAAGALGVLVASLVVACCALVPHQNHAALGLEVAVAGGAVMVQSVWVTLRKQAIDGDTFVWKVERAVTLLLPGALFFAGGLSLVAGGGGGLYWVFAATATAFVVSALTAWVLLVEVLR